MLKNRKRPDNGEAYVLRIFRDALITLAKRELARRARKKKGNIKK